MIIPFIALGWVCSNMSMSLWFWVAQSCTKQSSGSHQCWKEGKDHLPDSAGNTLPSTGSYLPLLWCPFASSWSTSYHQESQDFLCFPAGCPHLMLFQRESTGSSLGLSPPQRNWSYTQLKVVAFQLSQPHCIWKTDCCEYLSLHPVEYF